MAEQNQSVGARTQLLYVPEATWGVTPSANPTVWRQLRLLAGLSLQPNISIYQSNEIRSDRMQNLDVLGTMRPSGNVPFELSPQGWLPFIYHLLGGSVTTTGAGPYQHIVKGSPTLPVGFSLEQGHLDQASGDNPFYLHRGCRVNTMSLNFGIDQILSGTFGILMRESADPAGTTAATGTGITVGALATDDPFTSVQIAVLEGSSLTSLAIADSATLNVNNNFHADKGFAIGSNLRQNLKPGKRMVDGTLSLFFQNSTMLAKAKNSTSTKLRFLATSGSYSIQIDMANVRLLPNNGVWPNVTDDGPIDLNLGFKATKDASSGTDITFTLIVPEADITV